MLHVPPWGDFAPDGSAITVRTTDTVAAWTLAFGRFTGTSPDSGSSYDLDVARLDPDRAEVDATVAGAAWDVDRWLWGRGGAHPLRFTGDRALIHRLRAIAEVE